MNKFLCTMEPICDQWRRQDRLQQLFHQADPTCTHSSHINGAVEGQVSDPSQHSDDNDLEIDINETDASHLTQVLDSSSKSKLPPFFGILYLSDAIADHSDVLMSMINYHECSGAFTIFTVHTWLVAAGT